MDIPQSFQFGDILLYAAPGFIDDVIEWKTSGKVAHVELYAGVEKSWASRNGIGVNEYDFRANGLVCVKRPMVKPNESKMRAWFNSPDIKGSPYGWGDIEENLGFPVSSKDFDCSHFVSRALATGDSPQFDTDFDLSLITPRDFLISPSCKTIYGKT